MVEKSERSLYEYGKSGAGPGPDGDGGWKESFCTICTTAKAPHQCVKCQKNVCSEHFISLMGLCVDCAPIKDTGKAFKMSEPMSNEPSGTRTTEPTIQKVNDLSRKDNVITFGVEEPKNVRHVVLPPKNPPTAIDPDKKTKSDEDVIIFQRNPPKKTQRKNGKDASEKDDDRTIDIEWV